MLFNFDWLAEYLHYKVTPEEAATLLTRHAFEVLKLEKREGSWVLDIDVLPNRAADCLSHYGIARELNALLEYRGARPAKSKRSLPAALGKKRAPQWLNVAIEDAEDCDRYSMQLISGVKVEPSPRWLQERLVSLGVVPINNVVDIANYVMLDVGQPLHAFDAERLKDDGSSVRIVVRCSQAKEIVRALDGQSYVVSPGTLLITNQDKVLALAGIKGALEGSITPQTSEVLLESAHFSPQLIYRGSHTLKLNTDASTRFSYGLDPRLTLLGLARASELLSAYAHGKPSGGPLDLFPKKPRLLRIRFNPSLISERAGTAIKPSDSERALRCLGFDVTAKKSTRKNGGEVWSVTVPSHRLDIQLPEDLIEEALRFHGYEDIPEVFPMNSASEPITPAFTYYSAFKAALRGLGFDELVTYSLVPAGDLAALGMATRAEKSLKIANPLSIEREYLRPSLLPGLLRALAFNTRYDNLLRLSELGRVFVPSRKNKLPGEEVRLGGVALSANENVSGVPYPNGKAFFAFKGVVEAFLKGAGVSKYTFVPSGKSAPIWRRGHVAEILLEGKRLGFVGEAAPWLLKKLKLPEHVCMFEVLVAPLGDVFERTPVYREAPKFPVALRDVSLVVSNSVSIGRIEEVMREAGGGLVVDIRLFDWYEDPSLGEDKKSVAFHIVYRSAARTLTDAEVDKSHAAITEALIHQLDAVIR